MIVGWTLQLILESEKYRSGIAGQCHPNVSEDDLVHGLEVRTNLQLCLGRSAIRKKMHVKLKWFGVVARLNYQLNKSSEKGFVEKILMCVGLSGSTYLQGI